MRYLFTGLAYLVALVGIAAIASLTVLFLVGPHSSVLPDSFYLPVLALGWMAVIVLPILFARWIWRKLRVVA